MKFIAVLCAAFLLALVPATAHAGGSNDPTPYTVDTEGVTLPSGETFSANGHVNIKYLVDGQVKSKGIHFDPNNNQPGGHWIGHDFIPWGAFADDIQCVTWVQVAGYNEHFGEGGQEMVCLQKPPTAPPTDSEERERITKVNCEERTVEWVKEKREGVFEYDWKKAKWVQTGWKNWVEVDSGFRNEKADSCDDIPVVGSDLSPGLLAAGVLLLTGGVYMVRRARS